MRRALGITLVLLAVLIQVCLLPALRPLGVVPNLSLVLVVLVGMEDTVSMALMAAVVSGFVLDISSGANFGLWTGLFIVAALAVGLLRRTGVETGSPPVAVALVAVCTILSTAVILVGLAGATSHWPVGLLAVRLLTELGLNIGLVLVCRPLVRRLLHSRSLTLGAR